MSPASRQEADGFEELRPAGAASIEPRGAPAAPVVASIELAPRSSGRILDAALDLARARFGLLVLAASAIWLFSRALQPFIQRYARPDLLESASSDRAVGMFFGLQLLNLLVLFVVYSAATLVISVLCLPLLRGGEQSAGDAVGLVLRRAPGAMLIQSVVGLAVGILAGCTCGIGWFWIQWKLSLPLIVYVVEGQGIGAALTRSFQLTSRDDWGWPAIVGFLRWFAVYATAYVGALFFSMLVGVGDAFPDAQAAIVDRLSAPVWLVDVVLVVVSTLLQGVATAIGSVAMIAYYVDCRVRRDGVDLSQRLQALRARAAEARA